jgi:hypothetical protein
MTGPNDRFDALLDAMLTKPPLDVSAKPEPEDSDDLREPEDD